MSQRISSALAVILVSATAHVASAAPSKVKQCVAASDAAIALRQGGKLLEARERFLECTAATCPGAIRTACEKKLQETTSVTPSIVFDTKDGGGRDLAGVNVAVDDKPPVKLAGTPMELDPGDHKFVFTAEGEQPVTSTFVLHEGEVMRHERVVIGTPPPTPEANAVASDSGSTPATATDGADVVRKSPDRGQMVLGITTGALGLLGVGVGGAFGLMAFSDKSHQVSSGCTPTSCNSTQQAQSSSARSNGNTDAMVANIGFIGGGALLATGVVVLLTAPRAAEPRRRSGLLVAPSVGPHSSSFVLSGEF